jgi:hypothetical protein
MKKNFYIEIKGLDDPKEFIKQWSKSGRSSNEWRYDQNIDKVLEDQDSFQQLFYWKNDRGEKFTFYKERLVNQFWKQRKVLLGLRNEFNWERFEDEFKPSESSTIWKIFLLHLMNPVEFPIFDQNVYRFFRFNKDGKNIKEPPKKKKEVYEIYKYEYRDWFNTLRVQYKLNHKDMDRSFFTFGQLLKKIYGKPFEIKK